MRIRDVGGKHYLTQEIPSHKLPSNALLWWRTFKLGESDAAVVATHQKKIVGFFRFSTLRKVPPTHWLSKRTSSFIKTGELVACGTWVAPKFRKSGLASKLWRRVLIKIRPSYVEVAVASPEGQKLVNKLKKEFPLIDWCD